MNRRRVLIGTAVVGALAGFGYSALPHDRPLALVYRGPAACPGCSEAVATLLQTTRSRFRTEFCGPGERLPISPETLADAVVYAQPGGGEVKPAWRILRRHATPIRDFVRAGGHYLGFCLGAYLAGATPGFGLLPGDVDAYILSPGASVRDTDDTLVQIEWRGRRRTMYFQDGPVIHLRPDAAATVLATYDTGAPAAVVTTYGAGRVGVVGPHPEANQTWYANAGLAIEEGAQTDLGHDLIESTIDPQPPA